ncbi:MAG: lytic transglycosylase domain-containing protein [Lachnospiraceae bacterium]|nr:lytic transglycosylase domain-containing protein [Lachnospiraceae bacterium]
MNAQGVVVTPPVDATASVAAATSTNSTTAPADLEPIFEQAAQQYGISKDLLKAVAKAESNFNPSVVSSAGAIGVMQLMPDTAKSLGVTNPYDATENIMGGARYLSQLLSQYNGDTALALAAYNAGSGNVAKYGGIPPFKETQNYVNKILADAGIERTSDAATIYAVAANSATHTL